MLTCAGLHTTPGTRATAEFEEALGGLQDNVRLLGEAVEAVERSEALRALFEIVLAIGVVSQRQVADVV